MLLDYSSYPESLDVSFDYVRFYTDINSELEPELKLQGLNFFVDHHQREPIPLLPIRPDNVAVAGDSNGDGIFDSTDQ